MKTDCPQSRLPLDPPSPPKKKLPDDACDSHLHIFGEPERFPLAAELIERPADGSLEDWLGRLDRQMAVLDLKRAILVGSVAYREDNNLLIAALAVGSDAFRGIALVKPDVTLQHLRELRAAGVRGVRVNFRHAGALDFDGLKGIAPLLRQVDMHVQILLDSQNQFATVCDDLKLLDLNVVVDHMGSFNPDLEYPFSTQFLKALEEGWLYTKLSAAYRIEKPPYIHSRDALRVLLKVRPDRILWGSDWPYLFYHEQAPDAGRLADWVLESCSDDQAQMIFASTPASLYFKN